MKAAAEKECEEQSRVIAAQLARVQEEGYCKAAEMIVKQMKLEADAAAQQEKSQRQLDDARREAEQQAAAITDASERERREYRQVIEAQLTKTREAGERKAADSCNAEENG